MEGSSEEYIWYCPRRCNGILMKTSQPFLHEGKYQCKRCSVVFNTTEIMVRNRKNVFRYFKQLSITETKWSKVDVQPELVIEEEDLTPET